MTIEQWDISNIIWLVKPAFLWCPCLFLLKVFVSHSVTSHLPFNCSIWWIEFLFQYCPIFLLPNILFWINLKDISSFYIALEAETKGTLPLNHISVPFKILFWEYLTMLPGLAQDFLSSQEAGIQVCATMSILLLTLL